MSITPSNMLALGSSAPDFSLRDTLSTGTLSLDDIKGENGTLIIFICNHCPYVHHMIKQFSSLARDWKNKGIGIVAISSNDIENYPEDAPDKMTDFGNQLGFEFPYLYDESQNVAKAYKAACTPDPFLFDKDLNCFYRGQIDSSRPGNGIPVSGEDISSAIERMLNGEPSPESQIPSIGCNIKWKTT